jgi:hypothetical protein
MSFADYKKSPFDEALSKPLISSSTITANDAVVDTQSVTSSSSRSHNQQRSPIKGKAFRGSSNNDNQASSSSSSSNHRRHHHAAVFSKKLTSFASPSQQTHLPQPPPESFQSFHSNESNYQPPNLTLETTTHMPQHQSLEEALLKERSTESQTILQKMSTISAISTELNFLLSSQQNDIDEIEHNAYYVHDAAERGVNELENATGLMKNNSGVEGIWKYFFGVVSVGGLIIAFIIFLHSL